eukprot:Skav213543  [mRNA]  locus=scaffold4151:181102:181782:- [translate_table: standard]
MQQTSIMTFCKPRCDCGPQLQQMNAQLEQMKAHLEQMNRKVEQLQQLVMQTKMEVMEETLAEHVAEEAPEEEEEMTEDVLAEEDPEEEEMAKHVLAEDEASAKEKDWDTQQSQERLQDPEHRQELGGRFARYQMHCLSGTQAPLDSSDRTKKSSSELLKLLLLELEAIPEEQLKTTSRKNVRPEGESTTLQIPLGLVVSGTWKGIPMAANKTYISTSGSNNLSSLT